MTNTEELDKIIDEIGGDFYDGVLYDKDARNHARAAIQALIDEQTRLARIDELKKLKKECIIADVIRPGEADDIFHAVTQLSIDMRLKALERST